MIYAECPICGATMETLEMYLSDCFEPWYCSDCENSFEAYQVKEIDCD